MTAPQPEELIGVWAREGLVRPDGSVDDTTLVLWFQGRRLFADIRLPADGAWADPRAEIESFAGETELTPVDGALRCAWRRAIDLATEPGPPDVGLLRWEGAGAARRLREDGVHAPYYEIWRHAAAPAAGDRARRLCGPDGWNAVLVEIGERFLLVRAPWRERPAVASLGVRGPDGALAVERSSGPVALAPYGAEPAASSGRGTGPVVFEPDQTGEADAVWTEVALLETLA